MATATRTLALVLLAVAAAIAGATWAVDGRDWQAIEAGRVAAIDRTTP